jgi:quinol monooxygenase YgiN
MYMRLVHARYKPDSLPNIKKIYDEKIIPTLQKMRGCLFACLVRGDANINEGISLTLWDSQENAETYVKSGVFQSSLEEIKPFLSDSSEWKVQLTKDLKVTYEPVPEEPTVKAYAGLLDSGEDLPAKPMYLRLLSLKIKPGMMDEFQQIYQDKILPALKSIKGCRYAYLTSSIENNHESVSITIWDNRSDLEQYEKEGIFAGLLEQVKHTLSDLCQWKMALEKDEKWQIQTSDDTLVKYYSVLSSKGF